MRRIWQLRHSVSRYDACYVVIAEALGARVTTDARLGKVAGLEAPSSSPDHGGVSGPRTRDGDVIGFGSALGFR